VELQDGQDHGVVESNACRIRLQGQGVEVVHDGLILGEGNVGGCEKGVEVAAGVDVGNEVYGSGGCHERTGLEKSTKGREGCTGLRNSVGQRSGSSSIPSFVTENSISCKSVSVSAGICASGNTQVFCGGAD